MTQLTDLMTPEEKLDEELLASDTTAPEAVASTAPVASWQPTSPLEHSLPYVVVVKSRGAVIAAFDNAVDATRYARLHLQDYGAMLVWKREEGEEPSWIKISGVGVQRL